MSVFLCVCACTRPCSKTDETDLMSCIMIFNITQLRVKDALDLNHVCLAKILAPNSQQPQGGPIVFKSYMMLRWAVCIEEQNQGLWVKDIS